MKATWYLPASMFGLLLLPTAIFSQSEAEPNFQVERRDVVVNVTVTDSDGESIEGLSAADFELRDRGQPQTIVSFREVAGDGAPRCEVPGGFIRNDTLHTHGNTASLSKIVWIDTENASFEGIHASIRALVDEFSQEGVTKPAWTYVSDRRKLSLIENLWVANGTMMADASGEISETEARFQKVMQSVVIASDAPLLQHAQTDGLEQILYITRTLKRLRELAAEFTLREGKKQLLWVGGGFDTGLMMQCCKPQWNLTLELLNDADIEVSAMDPEGVRLMAGFSASVGASRGGASRGPPGGSARPGRHTDVLQVVAKETGGRFYANQNRLRRAYRGFADFTPHYYELVFSPAAETLDGKVHKLRVKVARKGVRLRHRTSYTASPQGTIESKPFETLMKTAEENLSAATSLCLGERLELLFPTETPTLRVLAWISGEDIQLNPQATGGYRGDLDVTILQRDSGNGELSKTSISLQLSFDEVHYQHLKREGFAFVRDIAHDPRIHHMMLIVGQYNSRKVGSLMLPVDRRIMTGQE